MSSRASLTTQLDDLFTPQSLTNWVKFCWLWFLVPVCALGYLYWDSLAYLVKVWTTDENYGHGFLVPFISLYLVRQRKDHLLKHVTEGSWWGLVGVFLGLALYIVGEFATLYFFVHVSLWMVIVGLFLAVFGVRGFSEMAFPLLYLLAMIPLPQFIIQILSGYLQLVSSTLGVECLQIVGVTAFRDGNVIDLGPIQLQVVEACSGLRYLFPLMSLALLCAYIFKDRFWKRAVVFFSSIPLAILLNGFRIGMIGVLVDLYGRGAAEGFYHFFEGWVLFVTSLVLIVIEMWMLSRIGRVGDRQSFLDRLRFGGESGPASLETSFPSSETRARRVSPAYLCSLVLLLPALVASIQISSREEQTPARKSFFDFPMVINEWRGFSFPMAKVYTDVLRFDDYILADFQTSSSKELPVNLYIAYYKSQKKGQSAHSPRTCIPGGGWEIASLEPFKLSTASGLGRPLWVNRAVIKKGSQKQLVYYWFQQRGRNLTNEYTVKWYLLQDALTKNRTDGALVRLTTAIPSGAEVSVGDDRLLAFAKDIQPVLSDYVPN